ncbi:MAG: hypothetical protein M3R59_11525 [Verrucomicrobiota bacterium]|nr:hypothetical protein [Verrucomicrobiota bacterium]
MQKRLRSAQRLFHVANQYPGGPGRVGCCDNGGGAFGSTSPGTERVVVVVEIVEFESAGAQAPNSTVAKNNSVPFVITT